MSQPLLEIEDLRKVYTSHKGLLGQNKVEVTAVDGIRLELKAGETLGIVGESGCGKSTLGRLIARLTEPSGGKVTFDGKALFQLNQNEMKSVRRDMQMVFQDPYASLNPRQRVQSILEEPLLVHGMGSKSERKERVAEVMKVAGFDPDLGKRYPHQFSGGQRQRIGIARALMTNPKLIIADEPVSALDVSIQAQILNLLKELQSKFSLTYLFISHDLGVVRHISDRVAVMYLGRLAELSDCESLYKDPLHPYTEALLSSVPVAEPAGRKEPIVIKGDMPNPADPPKGCAFHTRCPKVMSMCKEVRPELYPVKDGRFAACHLYA
ncbi:dipeptide ABC transporter ATP-binding protein [Bacillus mangrovi]|uniref:Dipeptide ABC transporter ATP-binding protein n=1 Tax=Metabacillus mangrovi TaxID=1491830 RepID=A0A7X2S904_9BACI|nr:dipeptide ABC transporter ATP-binding protein [Metabacillus mangrovi]MTH55465.1 dipeptide ABC transporter ATP-binding protein [Metabacillus mangrovi]